MSTEAEVKTTKLEETQIEVLNDGITPELDKEAGTPPEPESKEGESEDDNLDEVVVTIGDESPPPEDEEKEKAPEWVRDLRKAHRDTQRENRELKQKLEAKTPVSTEVKLVPKPKLENFDYDTEKYEKELNAWYDQKRKVDDQESKVESDKKTQQEAWQGRLNAYGEQKTKLKVKDFDDAEASAMEVLNQTQQGIIVQGAENSALVLYAIGKNLGKGKELASIKDPVKFAFVVARLEKDLRVKNRKAPPPPERTVNGTGPSSGSVDSTLERLRTEAEKTGDYTKVTQYRRQKRQN